MSTCQDCNQEIEDTAVVCPNCGRKQKHRSKNKWENRPLTPEEQDTQDKKYLIVLILIIAFLVFMTLRQFIF
jgi:uncharacterized membrane protein YvbJ